MFSFLILFEESDKGLGAEASLTLACWVFFMLLLSSADFFS